MNLKRILLVEGDASLCDAIYAYLSQKGKYHVKIAQDNDSAKKLLDDNHFNLMLCDMRLQGVSGTGLLEHVNSKQANNPQRTAVVLMAGNPSVEETVLAMKNGAFEVLEKPFQLKDLGAVIDAVFEVKDDDPVLSAVHKISLEDNSLKKYQTDFITVHPQMLALIENLKKVAASKATVLVQGESGTGKEVLANMIHNFSPRKSKPFIAINCAALPDNLLESELFGHEKGSFTGAIQRQIGKFELSDGGTILLDEISEMSLNMQTKLLRVLQECEVYRVGGNKPIPLNLRVIASTNRDLYSYMKAGHFREDLYYRINVIPIYVPPLRERGNDAIVLAESFLEEFSRIHDREIFQLDELARHKILHYPWHGNVRELRNAMERAVLVRNFDQIINEEFSQGNSELNRISTITENPANTTGIDFNKDMTLGEVEKRVIYETLRRCDGNRTKTAEKLGISLRTLRNKLKMFRAEEEGDVEKSIQ